jgi:Ran GTPase-activating protein (RanGAP) involved in mRNA processing and transport
VERKCHFRALEVSRCGLTDRSLQLILNAMVMQENTLESIDISDNLARLAPISFQGQIGHFGFIRRLNLSRVHRTSGPEPLVAPETMLAWRLEELDLSETPLNERTVDSISAYLASDMSHSLHELKLNQCGLTSRDVAVFMHSMSRKAGLARNLHLHVSENRLEKDHDLLVHAIKKGLTPSHLTMKMVEYQKEDHFRELVQVLRTNKTLKYLDISKASLPYDASDETCEALQSMFEENDTLEVLDISGEHAHLEVAKFGIGLNLALTGLKKNQALKVLKIEYQKLGLQGASTLSSVLEENSSLQEIYCEHNDINLQGLTVLLSGLANNSSVQFLPEMYHDRAESLQTVQREIESIRAEPAAAGNTARKAVRKSILVMRSRSKSNLMSPREPPKQQQTTRSFSGDYTEQDVQEALRVVNTKWDRQIIRLQEYLIRNYNLANGIVVDEHGQSSRPTTALSAGFGDLRDLLEQIALNGGKTGSETSVVETGVIQSEDIFQDSGVYGVDGATNGDEIEKEGDTNTLHTDSDGDLEMVTPTQDRANFSLGHNRTFSEDLAERFGLSPSQGDLPIHSHSSEIST